MSRAGFADGVSVFMCLKKCIGNGQGKIALLFGAISLLLTSLTTFSASEKHPGLSDFHDLGDFVNEPIPRLATSKPSASKVFSFTCSFVPTAQFALERTMSPSVIHVVVRSNEFAALLCTTNGIPYFFANNYFAAVLDELDPSTVRFETNRSVYFHLGPGDKPGEADFGFRLIEGSRPEIDINLVGALDAKFPAADIRIYDRKRRSITYHTENEFGVCLVLLPPDQMNEYGIKSFEYTNKQASIQMTNLSLTAGVREFLINVQLTSLRQNGLELKPELPTAPNALIPLRYPRNAAERKAAEELKKVLHP